MKEDTDYRNLVEKIQARAKILKQLKRAKGARKVQLESDLEDVQRWIRRLDQRQN